MDNFLRRFMPSLNHHLSDDRMASLFCDELPFVEKLIAKQHLATCWQCRVRQEDLEGRRADSMIALYRNALDSEELSLPLEPRLAFAQQLDAHVQGVPQRKWGFLRLPDISFPELPPMNPMLATSMVLGLAAVISFFAWWQQRVPKISSNALLVRAERWDTASLATTTGVVYQAVRITTTKQESRQTLERSIYRDLQGKRQPKRVQLNDREEKIKSSLTLAGLDWDEPLSASGFQGWHDHQRVREDSIVRTGAHLIKLTTRVPDGFVSEQTLTVRDTDFHPVRRTVAFRDSGTVEIAEVDFKILPWSAVDANLFEPLNNALPVIVATPARVLSFPRVPEVLTEGQLDEAELGARLVLNQLHADTNEQIEVHRLPQGVDVEGLVETDERKQILQAKLHTVPHLTVSIRSVADVKNHPDADDASTSIKMASMPDQPSPLAIYLQARGRSVSDSNIFAQQLFNNALEISQESKAIVDLETRFVPGDQKTIIASATLSELVYSHRERLEVVLKRQRALLSDALDAPVAWNVSPKVSSLTDAAAKNLALSKELTQTNSPAVRSAEKILAEMSATIDDLTADVRTAHGQSQSVSTLNGKK